ncbi:hypothetical protein TNIN_126341 [Trichonephila inaurata madagascariensis]|uniref:F-box domain-containing protein n=1 Tax=Trichonephila inaurata madagascariensis TaxID=2747483 RepID=A0A8X7BWY9_9ARAC|nr:hypothetical protein TNIN_126341 [Trichonephila inaurata madagascariensis]
MSKNIHSITQEELRHVFRFLNPRSRLTASLVCKQWLEAIDCPELLCDVKVKFSGETINKALESFSCMTRRFKWFSFYKVTIELPVVEFLMKYVDQFDTLSFTNCKIGDSKYKPKIQGKILHFDNLKTLEVQNSNITVLFAPFLNVTNLTLDMPNILTDYIICELSKSLRRLEKLTLGGTVICKKALCKRYYATEEFIETNPSREVLSLLSIKRLIEKNRNTLTHINFLRLRLSAEAVLTISKIEGLNLRSVSFPFKSKSSHIKEFCVNQFYLASLDLSALWTVTDDIVRDVCKCLPNLQELIIRFNDTIDCCITQIFQLKNLVKLDLCFCSRISYISYLMAVSILESFKLQHLNLAFTKISDRSLFELLECNPNMRYLNASGIHISNETLNMICRNLTLLECLVLESCPTISDSGLTGEFEYFSNSITPTPLSNLKYLAKFCVSRNNLITNQGCVKAIRFPELITLCLSECQGLILNNDFKRELRKQNPCLRHFCMYRS